jgi:hypothetical protein
MIEIKKIEDSKEDGIYRLFIDGVLVDIGKAFVDTWGTDKTSFSIVADDYETVQGIIKHSLSDFPQIEYLRLKYTSDTSEPIDTVFIHLWEEDRYKFKILFISTPDLSNWNKPYNFAEYCNELSFAFEAINDRAIEFNIYKNNDTYVDTFEITFSYPPITSLPIHYGISVHAEVVRTAHKKAVATLSRRKGFPIDNEGLVVPSQTRKNQHQNVQPIKLKEIKNSKYRGEYQLFIDDILIEKVSARTKGSESLAHPYYDIYTRDKDATKLLAMYSLSEFPPLAELHLSYHLDGLKYLNRDGEIWIDQEYEEGGFTGKFSLKMEVGGGALSEWREPFSFKEYAWEMFKALKAIDDLVEVDLLDSSDSYLNKEHRIEEDGPRFLDLSFDQINKNRIQNFSLKFTYSSSKVTIADELARIFSIIRPIHEVVVSSLTSRNSSNSISLSFDFREEIKVPCEQYLLYFAQFLKDLGVEAGTAIIDEAGEVLFTVTPTDKHQALDKIYAALRVYLNLPYSPISDSTHGEIAVQRLEANIHRLKGDLKVAAAELQAKNATIQAHQFTLEQQRRLLSGEIIIDSLKDVTPKQKDTDELFEGTLSNTRYEHEESEVDLQDVLSTLRRLVTDKE